MTTGRINQNHSTASCPGATIEPHAGVSMASPRWLAVSHALRRTPRGGANPSVTASNHGEPKLSKRPCICMHGPRLGTRRRWTPARGRSRIHGQRWRAPHGRQPRLYQLTIECLCIISVAPPQGSLARLRRSGIDTTRTGLIHVGAGLICIAEVAACLTLWHQDRLRRSRGRGAMRRRRGPPLMY